MIVPLLLAALAGCDGEEGAAGGAPKAEAPAPPAASAAPAAAPPRVWTTADIGELVPRAPERTTPVPKPIPELPQYEVALQTLTNVVERYAGDPENPWAIAHGLLARGAALRLNDGREAVPYLFSAYAEARTVGAQTFIGFPAERGPIRIEPHTDLQLKNLQEAGVPPDATFVTPAGEKSVADLYRYTLIRTYLQPKGNHSSFKDPNDIPWGAQALAFWAPDHELQWIAADGTPMDMDALADFLVAVITQESAFLFEAMQRSQPFRREGQPLFRYTCGGAHLLQGSAYVVARGFGSPKSRKAVEAQVPLLFWRLPRELAQYDEVLARNPKYRLQIMAQRLKFLGHFLESASKLSAMGLYLPDEEQLRLIEGAAQNLTLTVDALQKMGVWDRLPELKKTDEQLYLDLVGDSAHAVRGLELALGRGTVRW